MKISYLKAALPCLFVSSLWADARLEQLLGAIVDHDGITFQVPSNGCTQKQDFRFLVEERLEGIGPMLPALEHHHYITVSRMVSDACENLQPYGIQVFVSFEELGIHFGKFHINNPIGGDKITFSPLP